MIKSRLLITIILCSIFNLLPSSISKADSISIYAENDILHNQDDYYTHGTKISYFNSQNGWEYSLGQNIYTPEDKWTKVPDKGDRPYAGWLYGGVDKTWGNGFFQHYLELDLGIVGPHSYAGETQAFVHRLIKNHVPDGWDSQVGDELAGMILFQESAPLFNNPYFNLVPHADACAGNVMSYLGGGMQVEIGYNVENSLHNQITIKEFQPNWRAYLLAGADGRYVFNNIFLQGDTFEDYPYSVDLENWVADLEYGACLQYKAVKLYLTTDWRTKEFTTEDMSLKPFDSLKLSVSF
jgi:hypothetical protein